jgi:hypothetical protein
MSAPAWPPVLTATQDVAMADCLHPDPDDSFHCPQGDKPCPVTYQPGAWQAQLPAELAPAVQDRPQRTGELEASIQQALRRLHDAVAGNPDLTGPAFEGRLKFIGPPRR